MKGDIREQRYVDENGKVHTIKVKSIAGGGPRKPAVENKAAKPAQKADDQK